MRRGLLIVCLLLSVTFPGLSHEFMADYFKIHQLQGTIIVSSLAHDQNYIYNAPRANERYLPASTFKILNTLIALEEKAVADENEIIPWDGADKGLMEWNRDQSIKTAFPNSCVWFYQELAKRIGHDKYKDYFKKVNYGNQLTGKKLDTFWLNGDLRISAWEQVAFLKKVYKREFGFAPKHYDLLQRVMVVEKQPDYTIYAKTGWAARVTPQVGWYVGYVETKGDVWFFACNIDIREPKDARYRQETAMAALKELGII